MSDKVISIEERGGPFQSVFQRIMRMVPDRDRKDVRLQRLLAFRLQVGGESAIKEFLIQKIRNYIKCADPGTFYDFIKNDLKEKACNPDDDFDPPGVA